MSGRRGFYFPLAAVLFGSAVLRLWGISFGLPHTETRPDESTVIYIALRALLEDPRPASLVYPTCYTYFLSGVYAVYAVVSSLFAGGAGVAGLLSEYACRPGALFLINRLLVVASGVGTVYAAYRIGENYGGRREGFLSALFMGVCYLHVRDSHFGTLDVPMTLFIAWSVYYIGRWRNEATYANYMAAGLLAGLATGTKYAGVLLALHGLAAHVSARNPDRTLADALSDKKLWLFELAGLLGFFVSTPYAFLNFGQLLADFSYHKNLHGVMHGSNLWHHLSVSLRCGMGLPLLVAGVAGMALALVKDRWRFFSLFPFAVLYLLVSGKVSSGYVRYAIPLLPFLCAGAAYFCELLLRKAEARPRQRLMTVVLPVFLAAFSVYNSMRLDILLSRPDTRNEAASAAGAFVADGASVGMLCGVYGCPLLPWDTQFYSLRAEQMRSSGNRFKARLYEALNACHGSRGLPRYKKLEYDAPSGVFYSLSRRAEAPQWLVVARSRLARIDNLPPGADSFIGAYEPVFSVEGTDMLAADGIYDQEDAFYLPYCGFSGIVSPGPNLQFLRRR